MSRTTAAHSITKTWATAVRPSPDESRRHRLPVAWMLMSMAVCPSMDPARPRSAWTLASATSRWRSASRKITVMRTIMIGPPTNSAAVNCHPSKSAMMMPNSTTRLVEAISKTMAAVKSAPFRNSPRARATAA